MKKKLLLNQAPSIDFYRLEACVRNCFSVFREGERTRRLTEIHERLLRLMSGGLPGGGAEAGLAEVALLLQDLLKHMCLAGCLNVEDLLYVHSCSFFADHVQGDPSFVFVDFHKLLASGVHGSNGKFHIVKDFMKPLVRATILVEAEAQTKKKNKSRKSRSAGHLEFKRWRHEEAEGAGAEGDEGGGRCVSTKLCVEKYGVVIEVCAVFVNDIPLSVVRSTNDFVQQRYSRMRDSLLKSSGDALKYRMENLQVHDVVVGGGGGDDGGDAGGGPASAADDEDDGGGARWWWRCSRRGRRRRPRSLPMSSSGTVKS